MMNLNADQVRELRWKKFPVLNDGFVCLVDVMGDDSSIVQAARISFDNDVRFFDQLPEHIKEKFLKEEGYILENLDDKSVKWVGASAEVDLKQKIMNKYLDSQKNSDRKLIRYLMRNRHTTPFEMVEIKLLVRVPMDTWRQWIRHRTANVNEYSTRYTEAIDSMQTTQPDAWRLQAGSNKQGSDGFLPASILDQEDMGVAGYDGEYLSRAEKNFQNQAIQLYRDRLDAGVAREQARKDLPLSTYTEAYWKVDLHNLLHFLGLRMDSHAQLEIREYATVIGEQIIKKLFPVAWEAFEDYRLDAMYLTRLDKLVILDIMSRVAEGELNLPIPDGEAPFIDDAGTLHTQPAWMDYLEESFPDEWTAPNSRERDEFLVKLRNLGMLS